MSEKRKVHGEGNYEAARDYDERTRKYLENADVEADARRAEPGNEAEAKRLEQAERAGKRHAKDKDPALRTPRKSKAKK